MEPSAPQSQNTVGWGWWGGVTSSPPPHLGHQHVPRFPLMPASRRWAALSGVATQKVVLEDSAPGGGWRGWVLEGVWGGLE